MSRDMQAELASLGHINILSGLHVAMLLGQSNETQPCSPCQQAAMVLKTQAAN